MDAAPQLVLSAIGARERGAVLAVNLPAELLAQLLERPIP
jgi:hypothetical protein